VNGEAGFMYGLALSSVGRGPKAVQEMNMMASILMATTLSTMKRMVERVFVSHPRRLAYYKGAFERASQILHASIAFMTLAFKP
jgi:hypothetical protein